MWALKGFIMQFSVSQSTGYISADWAGKYQKWCGLCRPVSVEKYVGHLHYAEL